MTVSSVRTQKSHAHVAILPKPQANPKPPTKTQLNNVLGSWGFQSRNNPEGVFRSKTAPKELKPANILKDIVLSQPAKGIVGGTTVTAHVLKGSPQQVVYEQTKAGVAPQYAHRFFGPVRTDIMPK